MTVEKLAWDSKFFSKLIGKIWWPKNAVPTATTSLENFELLYVFLEEELEVTLPGFTQSYAETYVQFSKILEHEQDNIIPEITEFHEMNNSALLYELAFLSGNESRFKIDPYFTTKEFESLYRSWIDNSVTGAIADGIYIVKIEDKIAGFVTFKNYQAECKIGLVAVAKAAQGKGFGIQLMAAVAQQAKTLGLKRVVVTTQLSNKPACRFYKKTGYQIDKTYIIKHFWKR